MYHLKLVAAAREVLSSERSIAGTHETLTDVVETMVLYERESAIARVTVTLITEREELFPYHVQRVARYALQP
jgi:hypothetical protein